MSSKELWRPTRCVLELDWTLVRLFSALSVMVISILTDNLQWSTIFQQYIYNSPGRLSIRTTKITDWQQTHKHLFTLISSQNHVSNSVTRRVCLILQIWLQIRNLHTFLSLDYVGQLFKIIQASEVTSFTWSTLAAILRKRPTLATTLSRCRTLLATT